MISGAPKRENKACTPVDAIFLYKLKYTLTPLPAFSEQSLRLPEMLLLGLKSQNFSHQTVNLLP